MVILSLIVLVGINSVWGLTFIFTPTMGGQKFRSQGAYNVIMSVVLVPSILCFGFVGAFLNYLGPPAYALLRMDMVKFKHERILFYKEFGLRRYPNRARNTKESTEQCMLCDNKFQVGKNLEIVQVNCDSKHLFHKLCFEKALKFQQTCMICCENFQ